MKKLIYLACVSVFSLVSYTLNAQNLEVTHQANGTTIAVPIQSIDSVRFRMVPPPVLKNIYQSNGNILGIALADVDSITYSIPDVNTLPTLLTESVTVLSSFSAFAGGNVTDDGGAAIIERGICWNTSPNVSIANNTLAIGEGIGAFSGTIAPLSPDTIYYLRAYATNANGTAYGNEVSFITQTANTSGNLPTISTAAIDYQDGLSATSGGSITADGGLAVTARGVCWAIGVTPTINNTHSLDGAGAGDFTSELTNLLPNTSYFARAYATNDAGTAYGITFSFTTNALAEVVTEQEVDLLFNQAILSGEVVATGNSSLQEIGFCWSETPNPSIEDNTISNTPSVDFTGSFSNTITELTPNQTYFYRAYAINEMGVSYGTIREFEAVEQQINTLDCENTEIQGDLISDYQNENVQINIPYTGGNGGAFESQSFTSTGVEGLTATLQAGGLAIGDGILTVIVSGEASTLGTASFEIEFLGETCTIELEVIESPYPEGTVFCDNIYTQVIEVTNPETGMVWMDRNLGASQAATSSTDAQAYGDLYQWGRGADGHQCRNSSTTTIISTTDQPEHGDFILPPFGNSSDWRAPQNDNLWQGVNGVNNPCPSGYRLPTETEINAERTSWSSNNAAGAFASPLKLPMAGYRSTSNGSLLGVGSVGSYWSITVSGTSARRLNFVSTSANMNNFNRAIGNSVRCLKDEAEIGSLDCENTEIQGTAVLNLNINGLPIHIPYSSGNGEAFVSQSFTSTGVEGLTATLQAGDLAIGDGILNLIVSGEATTLGTASFEIEFLGETCAIEVEVIENQYPEGTVFCDNIYTPVIEVTNPETGMVWMDRNLGASQVATSSTDANAYGDLYQWGRRSDGHQCRYSSTTPTLSSTDTPAHGSFILPPNPPFDWRSPQNTNLWQGVNGVNNPCPSGYRLPTETELNEERTSWSNNNAAGAFASPLKLPMAGFRSFSLGSLYSVGTGGGCWSSTVSGTNSRLLVFGSSSASMNAGNRTNGLSVRCLKD